MTITVLAAYAPGPGHYNTLRPLVEDLAAQPNCRVYWCGSQAVANFVDTAPVAVPHRPAGFETFLPSSAGVSGDDIIRRMGQRSRDDIGRLMEELHPDLVICDTSERGAVLAARDRDVPFLRVVSCADAATARSSTLEARRRTLIRGQDGDDLRSPWNLGTVGFGPRWFFTDDHEPGERLRCYRYRPSGSTPVHPPSRPARPRALISFGTFITEPSAEMLEQAMLGLVDAGIKSITIKIRLPTSRARLQEWTELNSARTDSVIEVCSELDLAHHLTEADILLCHGSATSTLEALYRQVTPVIAPSHNDAYFVARRCADSNTAITIDWATGFTRQNIRTAATTALHSLRIADGIERFTLDNNELQPINSLAEHLTRTVGKNATR
ncbi:glycosyltransferase [Nocardia sp. NBC_01327]|uniref:glycosyltransferase n=1 Tax=Nocardia sp. NBC_01327 TaxID=2903593 RepID=UPI002E11BA7D|nr:hypothetical protein OG326_34540 [Nocardia sp. NBC_01327]